jgi:DNA-binding winged helix-turn-helix (wHTH) protein/Tol biopolymer transport system component
MKASLTRYRFGPFELDPTRYELLRGSRRIRLSTSLMELLSLFVARQGELVTRDQIVAALWKEPASVDVHQGINTAVGRLRAALGDDPAKPRYLETVIGKGYRFIEPVDEISPSEPERVTAFSSPANDEIAALSPLADQSRESADLHGWSGSRIAAQSKPSRQRLSTLTAAGWLAGFALILTASLFLYLERKPSRSTLWTQRQITNNDVEVPVTAAAISADGQSLAYTTSSGLFLRDMATGAVRQLKAPAVRTTHLTWFPGRTRVLVTGYAPDDPQPQIWLAFTAGGEPQLFRRDADCGVPSPDGRAIAFTSGNGREVHVSEPGGTHELTLDRDDAEGTFSALFWSADSRRISYQQRRFIGGGSVQMESSYLWSYQSRDVVSGRQTAFTKDMPFDSAAESAKGYMFFLRARGGSNPDSRGMWRLPIDPLTGALRSKPTRICCEQNFDRLTDISVTADGKLVAALKELWQPDVFVADLHLPGPTLDDVQRLTSNIKSDFPHAWDAKSEAVYFESNSAGDDIYHLFRQKLGQHDAETLTLGENFQILPAVMPDGKTLVYEQRDRSLGEGQRSIFRANLDGSSPRLVWRENPLDEWRCPELAGTACVLRETDAHQQFFFYALDLEHGKGRLLARAAWLPTIMGDWALSPDGRVAAIPDHDKDSPSIQLVRLDGAGGESKIRVHPPMHLRGLAWAPDESGFFAGVTIGVASWLEFISTTGETTALRRTAIQTWSVPSPDGKKLAFVDSSTSRNVYIWQ